MGKAFYTIISNGICQENETNVCNKVIKRSNHGKYLGVIKDDQTSFIHREQNIVKQISTAAGILLYHFS